MIESISFDKFQTRHMMNNDFVDWYGLLLTLGISLKLLGNLSQNCLKMYIYSSTQDLLQCLLYRM